MITIDETTEERFQNLVVDIQKDYSKTKAIAIDSMIFDLYNLSKEERDTIGYIEI